MEFHVEPSVELCHWYVIPEAAVNPTADNVNAVLAHPLVALIDAAPALGVPEQGVLELQPNLILGLLVVELPDEVAEEHTVEASALNHLDQVPVPRPVVVHCTAHPPTKLELL
jgi:hypothetical protein